MSDLDSTVTERHESVPDREQHHSWKLDGMCPLFFANPQFPQEPLTSAPKAFSSSCITLSWQRHNLVSLDLGGKYSTHGPEMKNYSRQMSHFPGWCCRTSGMTLKARGCSPLIRFWCSILNPLLPRCSSGRGEHPAAGTHHPGPLNLGPLNSSLECYIPVQSREIISLWALDSKIWWCLCIIYRKGMTFKFCLGPSHHIASFSWFPNRDRFLFWLPDSPFPFPPDTKGS